jgi:hypothetical protein
LDVQLYKGARPLSGLNVQLYKGARPLSGLDKP